MNTCRISSLALRTVFVSVLLTTTSITRANDIVDFLRAINGISEEPRPHMTARPAFPHGSSRHGSNGYGSQSYSDRFHADDHEHGTMPVDRISLRHGGDPRFGGGQSRPVDTRFGRVSGRTSDGRMIVRISSNGGVAYGYDNPLYIPNQDYGQSLPPVAPPAPVYPNYPTVPSYPQPPFNNSGSGLPCEMGQIVTWPVPLASCVYVEDEENIAPHAVPVTIAVRDPRTCGHECHERLVFVQVCVPRCPPQCVTVSPCRTRVKLDYGRYQVDIKTCDDHIVVDYDN